MHFIKRSFSSSVNIKQMLSKIIKSNAMINNVLQSSEVIKNIQWVNIREDLVKSYGLKEITLDSHIIDICFYYKRYEEAKNYYKFLESNNYEINLNVLGNYIKSFSLQTRPIIKEEEEEILRVYTVLRKRYKYLDKKTCTDCIDTLTLTKQWKETLSLIKILEEIGHVGCKNFKTVINTALKNNDAKLAWELMNLAFIKESLDCKNYINYFDYCKKNFNGIKLIEEIEKIFYFWRKHKIQPPKYIINIYSKFFKSTGYAANETCILKTGHCSYCNLLLQKTDITEQEFKILSSTILENLIIGENLFYATTTSELEKYMRFINSIKPYDVVIDGLNVAYSYRHKDRNWVKHILNIIDFFKGQRVLVIGRSHMKNWSNEFIKNVQKKAEIFLINDVSEDDSFLLHVTLKSGPNTYFVSRDLMRTQKFKLYDPNIKNLFVDWQISRQYFFKRYQNTIKLIPPPAFELKAQKYKKDWHIPYIDENKIQSLNNYTVPETWLCLKYVK